MLLAQVASSSPTDLWATIAQYGLLGVLFVLVSYALIRRDSDLTEERRARLADALAMRNLIEADTSAKTATNKLTEEHNRLMETLARNQEALVTTATHLNDIRTQHDNESSQKIIDTITALWRERQGTK